MHHVLIEIGPAAVHSYGFFLAAGFFVGIWSILLEVEKRDLPAQLVPGLSFWTLFFFLLGARLLYIAFNPLHYWNRPFEALMLWQGGLVMHGGIVTALFAGFVYLKVKSQPLFRWADTAAPGLALGFSVASLGCLVTFCSDVTVLPSFLHGGKNEILLRAALGSSQAKTGIAYVLAGLFTFCLLAGMKKRSRAPGTMFGLLLTCIGLLGSAIELFWGRFPLFLEIVSFTQIFFFWVLAAGLLILCRRSA